MTSRLESSIAPESTFMVHIIAKKERKEERKEDMTALIRHPSGSSLYRRGHLNEKSQAKEKDYRPKIMGIKASESREKKDQT